MALTKIFDVLGNSEIVMGVESFPAWDCTNSKKWLTQEITECHPIENASGSLVPRKVYQAVSLEMLMLFFALLMMSMTSKELAATEWDLEWLYTLPIPFSTLIGIRIFERTIVNPAALLLLWPFLTILSVKLSLGFSGLVIALLATILLSFLFATFRTLVDTGLRMVFSPSKLRNLQAVISIFATIFLLFALSANMSE